jgi:hypothetical protein
VLPVCAVFHATLLAPHRGPLRVSGRVTPYDLEVLREHARAYRGPGARLEVRLAPAYRVAFSRALGDLGRLGVELVLAD